MTRLVFLRTFVSTAALVCSAFSASGVAMSGPAGQPARNGAVQRARSSQNPACGLLTAAEVRTLTGFSGYGEPTPGDAPGEGVGGGASCQFDAPLFAVDARGKATAAGKGPMLSIVLIDGKNYTQTMAVGRGCTKEPVSGVGELAFFAVCPASKLPRTSPLYVKAGSKDLIVQMDIEAPETEASLRPKVLAVAKAALAKLK
jgi:hypothetical protein